MTSALRIDQFLEKLASHHNFDLRGYKYSTLQRRTRRRMEQLRITTYDDYLDYIRQHPGELNELLSTVLINVTKFFRDMPAWEWLRLHGLPMLLPPDRGIEDGFKVWCAGCSTGEEAYSVAILLAMHLGDKIHHHDIKIYATDKDEHALTIARKAEYDAKALQHVPAAIRERFFTGTDRLRLDRDLRRLVIFGRSDLISDAPISHVKLLLCRNVLIYFDPSAQKRVMNRLQYSVEPGGMLFLGKSESQLRTSPFFWPVNTRWRFSQRTQVPSVLEKIKIMSSQPSEQAWNDKAEQELRLLRLYHNTLLHTLQPGILLLDNEDNIVNENDSIRRLWNIETSLRGAKLHESALTQRCPELIDLVAQARQRDTMLQIKCVVGEDRHLSVMVKPVHDDGSKDSIGILIYAEDVSPKQQLDSTIEELQSVAQELQSSNEELETTNEELQSTNEELETTNEELQSANEELETTNEELKSLNEELEDINDELAQRSKELEELSARHSEMVERMPWPMLLANQDGVVSVYNAAAQKLFGFATPSAQGMELTQLPMSPDNRAKVIERFQESVTKQKLVTLTELALVTNSGSYLVNLQINPLSSAGNDHGILVMFEERKPAATPPRAAAGGNGSPPKVASSSRAASTAKASKGKAKIKNVTRKK